MSLPSAQSVHEWLLTQQSPDAEGMAAYMRHRFRFYGLKKPQRTALFQAWWQPAYGQDSAAAFAFARQAWAYDYRELHYWALDVLEKNRKGFAQGDIAHLEWLVRHQSWWDSVDWLAIRLMGHYFRQYPAQIAPITEAWIADEDAMWLQRCAILFQLKYREQTDVPRLFDYILATAHSREFFIQKANGWALRELAKRQPEAVRLFLGQYELPALTRREAGKHLGI